MPEGEDQPTTDVDLFISTERLKVVNSTTKVSAVLKLVCVVVFIHHLKNPLLFLATLKHALDGAQPCSQGLSALLVPWSKRANVDMGSLHVGLEFGSCLFAKYTLFHFFSVYPGG